LFTNSDSNSNNKTVISIAPPTIHTALKPKSDSEFFQSYLSAWSAKFGDVQDTLSTKRPFWDRPGVLEDKALVEASLNSIHLRATALPEDAWISTHHSGDWLFAMPIASCV